MGTRLCRHIVGLTAALFLWGTGPVWAAFALGNPAAGAIKSGVGLISGWVCDANRLEVSFDGEPRQFVPYGSERPDTRGVCGDTNNGFGLLTNYNELGDGPHSVTLYIDGAVATRVNFSVKTLGTNFLRGVTGQGTITLSDGKRVNVQWEETTQGFTITGYTGGDTATSADAQLRKILGTWRIIATDTDGTMYEATYTFSTLTTINGNRMVTGTVRDSGGTYPLSAGLTDQLGDTPPSLADEYPYSLGWGDSLFCYVEFFSLPTPTTLTGLSFYASVSQECNDFDNEAKVLRLEGVRISGP